MTIEPMPADRLALARREAEAINAMPRDLRLPLWVLFCELLSEHDRLADEVADLRNSSRSVNDE